MKRRTWIQSAGLMLGAFAMQKNMAYASDKVIDTADGTNQDPTNNDRAYWVSILSKMAQPILENISKGTFQKNMPMVVSESYDSRNPKVGYLEAFGRLLAGMAPWLGLKDDDTEEGKLRKKYREQALLGIQHGFDPNSADYFDWRGKEGQTLVDAAHLALGILRAPQALWEPLPEKTKQQVIEEMKYIRWIKPGQNNWLLFASITETFLYTVGVEPNRESIDLAINKFDQDWYVGDGWYSDGSRFAFDHYNGYIIHCMLVETLKHNLTAGDYQEKYDRAYKRMQRYAHHLERMISPEGYFPIIGRSSTYRNGAFQPLAQVALDKKLPENLSYGQIRNGLTAILKSIYKHDLYDQFGWLILGFTSKEQGNIADTYTNTGSLYEATLSFLPLGLPADDEFWTAASEELTSQRAFSGKKFPKDYQVKY